MRRRKEKWNSQKIRGRRLCFLYITLIIFDTNCFAVLSIYVTFARDFKS